MITIEKATVETLDSTHTRDDIPVGSTVLSVTIGDHVFQMLVGEDELIDALASRYTAGGFIFPRSRSDLHFRPYCLHNLKD